MARKSIIYASAIMIIAAGVLLGVSLIKGPSHQIQSAIPPTQTLIVQTQAIPVSTTIQKHTPIPVATTTPSPPPFNGTGNRLMTCTQQRGTIVTAGQAVNGTWLDASDTFSCSAFIPTQLGMGNQTITLDLFNLTIIQNDNLGTIVP